MTQTLDISQRVALDQARAAPAATPARTATTSAKLETFAITFGIAYAILYTLFERWNWPLFTYHPAINQLDLFKEAGKPEDGPPMFWYGWVALSTICATVVGGIATLFSKEALLRATVFFCVLAVLWPVFYALAALTDQYASFNADFLRSVWVRGIPALLGALAAAYLVSPASAERTWTGWLMILPIGGLAILGYSLLDYFQK
jgi:hypothetical protein